MAVAPRAARTDVQQRVPDAGLLERPLEPLEAEPRQRPGLVGARVEGVDADDDERHVDERQDRDRRDAQEDAGAARLGHRQSASKAPSRRASER